MGDNKKSFELIKGRKPSQIYSISKGIDLRSEIQKLQSKATNPKRLYFFAFYEI